MTLQPKSVEKIATQSSDDINRIIIGLGGQGSRVVNEVRKAVVAQGALPAGVEFIAIDSDRIALTNLDSVPEDQRVYLPAPDDNITETIVPWLPHEFRPKAGGGCGMQRLTGKAMYLVHRARILEVVREVARRLRQRTQVSNFMVVLVNAFGGGTGSGMTIDFSIDVRGELKELTGQDPLMFGLGILPSRAETIQRANGVALIKELHLLLSRKEPIVVGGRDYSNPFELYFLVGREMMGIERDEDLLHAIVRFTIDLGLIPSSSRDHSGAGKGAGWVDLQDIRTLVKGAGHMFATFGYYRAAFPGQELLEYFTTLDRAAALRLQLPKSATDAETERRALEDRKIAVGHEEEILRQAEARATRLRATGVLGANRPELAKLLVHIGRMADEIEKRRREVEEAEAAIPRNAEKRAAMEAELHELELRAEALRAAITTPAQTRTGYRVTLSDEEFAHLTQNRELVKNGTFRSLMAELGRLPEYHDRTMEVIGKSKVLYMPLLNYRMSFHTAALFPPAVLSRLARHGFVRFDAAGNPIISDDQLWMVMAMLASMPENIDADKVSARAFKEVVENYIARRAEVKTVPSKSKRYEVVVHSWMVGLQISPVSPGYPPRLRELEWLMPEYEKVAREGELAQHHAFLYGDPVAFSKLTSLPVERVSVAKTHEAVTEYWARYVPIDAPARWHQLPPVIAETAVAAEDLATATATLADAVAEFQGTEASLADVDRLLAALGAGSEAVDGFQRRCAQDVAPLRERLGTLIDQLERTKVTPKDPARLLAMEELAAEALGAAAEATQRLTQLRAAMPAAIRDTFARIRGQHNVATVDRLARRSTARWDHHAAQAEARAARLLEAAVDALTSLAELERTLERAQILLRGRSLEPFGGALDRAAAPVLRIDAPPLAGPANGNGHHGNGHHTNGDAAHASGDDVLDQILEAQEEHE